MDLLLGDCKERLGALDTHSIDAVVTDPPYGLNFMGKKWDYDVPSVEIWREVFRVLKPGGHLLAFGGTRTYHRLVVAIEDAGFEIRDQVQWIYGQGFPKSLNISKAIEKSTQPFDYAEWDGFGTALKPANEPICLARKPLEKGLTVAANVQKWGTGGLNIDGSRIGTETITQHKRDLSQAHGNNWAAGTKQPVLGVSTTTQGRFPANVIFDEAAGEMLDGQTGNLHPSGNKSKGLANNSEGMFGIGEGAFGQSTDYKDKGGASRFFKNISGHTSLVCPFCHWVYDVDRVHDCKNPYQAVVGCFTSKTPAGTPIVDHMKIDPVSRFFYCAKASTSERNAGCEGMPEKKPVGEYRLTQETENPQQTPHKHQPRANFHPTVKPIKLMEYLVRLITPPGGVVLDPFMGSGTTGVAARRLGFGFTGIELSPEYFEIARNRILNQVRERIDPPDQVDLEDFLGESHGV